MNSKFLIIQIDIGKGTQWGESNTIDPIREIFIPSVKSYCAKYNYDYVLIKESRYEKNYGHFLFSLGKLLLNDLKYFNRFSK